MAAPPHPSRTLAALMGIALMAAGTAQAQSAGKGFLFKEPRVMLTLRGGLAHATAGSDIFSFTTEQLTVQRSDFTGFTAGGDVSVRLTPRVDFMLSGSYTGSTTDSEFRDWVDDDDRPIEQTTKFERAPVTAGVKAYLLPRGRTVGSFAWLPARAAPYIGAAGGGMWYRFRQEGDFVDFKTLDVFPDVLESTGWAPTAQGIAGADFSLTPHLVFTTDARYTWAKTDLGVAFEDFEPIDLSGLSATIGISVRF